ncbi:branched-chain amino acid ABC transporter permease [Pseudohalocynthiibacter aestuariivivens]|uniref:AzlC family ABC transporter permease n=1 Tax=Roseovarius pelagicus TaxID=2980108 RepID=A0ABY6DH32_9RHOB|nr:MULTISPECIES: AzlC family ABC transporter permease [Rhodobacterales]QIE46896.1 branched-chain amino acid ABC transporter permease [Pseudohalocynthiibacter aestuariivivens]UXX84558.1 AzlC family ABC transporter permease [Roseovarius pelagicus]
MQSTKSPYWQGVRAGLPFILILAPFGTLFGVVAAESGLNLFEALVMSVLTIAGASQFTALQLLNEQVPTLIVILAALTVNLRLAMYSAALTPHLGQASPWMRASVAYCIVDQTSACSIAAYEENPDWTLRQRLAFFWGVATPIMPNWMVFTCVGALVGEAIPEEAALDFAIPITFIALVVPMMRTGAHRAAALAGIVASLMLTWLPYSLGIIVAGMIGMMVGAEVERRGDRA